MKGKILLAAAALIAGRAYAQQRSLDEVVSIAHTYYNNMSGDASLTRADAALELIPSSRLLAQDRSAEIFYLCNTRNRGFVLVSADVQMPEVLGYSDEAFDSDKGLPPGLLEVMSGYADLTSSEVNTRAAMALQSDVSPMLQTLWDQGDPYNRMCPKDGSFRTQTGCVATAVAQVMKFYEWPAKTGKGIIDYKTYRKGIPVKIDLSDYSFAWSSMLNAYEKDKFSNAQANAVSKLMYAAGAASETDYSSSESGSTLFDSEMGLWRYFGYDKDMSLLLASYMSDERWLEILVSELNARRPVMMSANASGKNVGHAFVLDGCQEKGGNLYFHVNWGWSGSGNGYYMINKLSPAEEGKDMGAGLFSESQLVLVNCQPDDGKDNDVYAMVQAMRLEKDYFESGSDIQTQLDLNNLVCCLPEGMTAKLMVEVIDEGRKVCKQVETKDFALPMGEFIKDAALVQLSSLADGSYGLHPYLRSDDGRNVELLSRGAPLQIQVGGTQSIDALTGEPSAASTYDLHGRVKKNAGNKALPAGFYIINGQKIVIQ